MRARRLCRLCRTEDPEAAFDGEGARRYGGRWNRPGTRAVYTASSLSLAVLENLVHFDLDDPPEARFWFFFVEIPDDVGVETIDIATMPTAWETYPGPDALRDIGTQWANSGETAVLEVPSAVVPESNFLVNPVHPDFYRLAIAPPKPYSFDFRLFADRD